MEILSLVGIVVSVAVFAFLAIKGFNLFFNGVIASLILMLFSQLPLLETLNTVWITGVQAYFKSLLLVFTASAVFGYFMEEAGCIRRVAMSLASLVQKCRSQTAAKWVAVMILPLLYFTMIYTGVNAMVIVFTVLGIGRDMFKTLNIPWRYYMYGSAGVMPAYVLGGSLGAVNVVYTRAFADSMTTGFVFSLILVIIGMVVIALQCLFDIKKAERTGEGFMVDGAGIDAANLKTARSLDDCPNIWASVIPMVSPIVLIWVFRWPVVLCLCCGIILCIAINLKHIKSSLKKTVTGAIIAAAPVMLNVAGATGFAVLLRSVPGFGLITGIFDNAGPLVAALGIPCILGIMSGSAEATATASSPLVVENMTATGINMATAKVLTKCTNFCFSMPHNTGYVNTLTLTKVPYGKGILVYMKTTYAPGIVMLAVGLILHAVGIF